MKHLIYTVLILFLIPAHAKAMEFSIFQQSDMGLNIVVAEGEIVDGDAERFSAIANKADRDEEGDIILVLNSMGGSVDAAFKMAKVIEKVGVFTIVPDQAVCASACASILYTAGNRRNLLEGGRLGFHTCYLSDGKTVARSSFCNDVIAEHAMSNGLSHASVSLFVNEFGADEIAWVGPDVACTMLFGMCRTSLDPEAIDKEHERDLRMIKEMVEEFSDDKPSFDCLKASTIQEKMICSVNHLAYLDRKMAELYRSALAKNTNRVQSDQRAWLKYSRNQCQTQMCLEDSYHLRIKELSFKKP